MGLQEGREIVLPCAHCKLNSLQLSIRTGTATVYCPKCSRPTRVRIERGKDKWIIRSTVAEEAQLPRLE